MSERIVSIRVARAVRNFNRIASMKKTIDAAERVLMADLAAFTPDDAREFLARTTAPIVKTPAPPSGPLDLLGLRKAGVR